MTPFLKQIRFLGQKLGPLLVQLPPRCAFNYVIAKRFFALLRERHEGNVVLEARHESWFETGADDLLNDHHCGRRGRPRMCSARWPTTGHGQISYFRLHGAPRRYYSSYPVTFLKAMARRMVNLAKEALVWCVFDNTAAGFAAPNALELAGNIAKTEGDNSEPPSYSKGSVG